MTWDAMSLFFNSTQMAVHPSITVGTAGDISHSHLDLNIKVIRNYSGNGHGKGEVDTAAGFLKTYRSQK